ncbi:SDR family NAD(P)-dependent oxidoreductase [Aquimarina sp. RZ0]|uniref:SDR family NAD(P)-dependent oxidoreductase n=1 Tax=Aquimarina sp. RZ0 TaxID=2607730 RepID=UPI0011F1A1C8|nr:SDR family oxidoreductase [Aquimarina sp. RZ0]KAA1244948.1 SDR family oxidoreductase [Aquimarina sp. RZ0]
MIHSKFEAEYHKIVIVGINSGIGQALLSQFLESKAMIFGLDIQKISKASTHANFQYFQVNPLDIDDMLTVVSKIETKVSQIDSLINLSGTIKSFKTIASSTVEDWNETYDISFKSCFNACKLFSPLLKKSNGSAIVNMSSGLAFIGQKNYGPYSASKASVLSLSKTLATELAPSIRVNTVAPGAVNTDFIYQKDGSSRFDIEQYQRMIPLGSIAKPEEISSVILFLLSTGASHITGQCIHINGGAMML